MCLLRLRGLAPPLAAYAVSAPPIAARTRTRPATNNFRELTLPPMGRGTNSRSYCPGRRGPNLRAPVDGNRAAARDGGVGRDQVANDLGDLGRLDPARMVGVGLVRPVGRRVDDARQD